MLDREASEGEEKPTGIFRKKQKSIESAILGGDLRQVKKHLSGGLDVNAPLDSRGSCPIHYAVNSTPEVLLLLIDRLVYRGWRRDFSNDRRRRARVCGSRAA